MVKKQAIEYLKPHQLSVGVKGGAEAIVHATAALLEKYAERLGRQIKDIPLMNK